MIIRGARRIDGGIIKPFATASDVNIQTRFISMIGSGFDDEDESRSCVKKVAFVWKCYCNRQQR